MHNFSRTRRRTPLAARGICGGYEETPPAPVSEEEDASRRARLKDHLLREVASHMSDQFLDVCGKSDNAEWFLRMVALECKRTVTIWFKEPTVWDARMEAAMTGVFLPFTPDTD